MLLRLMVVLKPDYIATVLGKNHDAAIFWDQHLLYMETNSHQMFLLLLIPHKNKAISPDRKNLGHLVAYDHYLTAQLLGAVLLCSSVLTAYTSGSRDLPSCLFWSVLASQPLPATFVFPVSVFKSLSSKKHKT